MKNKIIYESLLQNACNLKYSNFQQDSANKRLHAKIEMFCF